MSYIMFPENAINAGLSPHNKTIFLQLLQWHLHHAHGNYDVEFYITDRDLASTTGCCRETVRTTKKRLRDLNLITYRIGPKNRTYYKIISHVI
ncbi:hypothetical protein ES705_45913 [subsurface metagenome]